MYYSDSEKKYPAAWEIKNQLVKIKRGIERITGKSGKRGISSRKLAGEIKKLRDTVKETNLDEIVKQALMRKMEEALFFLAKASQLGN